jgi:hypothetical protein
MALSVSFGDIDIQNGQIMDLNTAHQPCSISIKVDENQYHTIIIYDLSAPQPRNPINSPLIHFLDVNIPGSKIDKGDILFPYLEPSPPAGSGNHVYVIDLFGQSSKINPEVPRERISFPVMEFVKTYPLKHQNRFIFQVIPDQEKSPTRELFDGINSEQSSPRAHENWTKNLTEQDAKYCDCIIEVAGNQPESCNAEKAWYERREGRKCGNPYPICRHSIEGVSGRPECGQNYIFENIPDKELLGYASLNGITIPQPYNREMFIQTLYDWENNKKYRYQQLQQDLASGQIHL